MSDSKSRADHFAKSTTMHGLHNWLRSNNPAWRRIGYFTVWLVMTVITVCQLYGNLRHYLRYETKVSFEYRVADSLKFPSITLCPESAYKKSEIGGHKFGLQAFLQYFPVSHYRNVDQCQNNLSPNDTAPHGFRSLIELITHWRIYYEREGARKVTHSLQDLILKCSFKMVEFNCSESWIQHNSELGPCFTFNYGNPVNTTNRSLLWFEENYKQTENKTVQGSGSYSGLKLLLSVEKEESCLLVSGSTNGFYVHIHDQNTIPAFLQESSILLAAGTRTQIAITQEQRDSSAVENLGRCVTEYFLYMYANSSYSKDNCILQCLTEDIWKQCGCLNIFLPVDTLTAARRLNDTYFKRKFNETYIGSCYFNQYFECMWEILGNYRKHGISRCKQCPDPCCETTYHLQVSAVPYPSDQIVHHLINTTKFKTAKEIRENLLEVDIFFQSMQYRETVETRVVTLGDMFSSIGGTLGLYLGASLLTIIEVLEFLISSIFGCKYETATVRGS